MRESLDCLTKKNRCQKIGRLYLKYSTQLKSDVAREGRKRRAGSVSTNLYISIPRTYQPSQQSWASHQTFKIFISHKFPNVSQRSGATRNRKSQRKSYCRVGGWFNIKKYIKNINDSILILYYFLENIKNNDNGNMGIKIFQKKERILWGKG